MLYSIIYIKLNLVNRIIKMMTQHSVMTLLLYPKSRKFDKFCDFLSDIDSNSKTDVFRDVIYLIIINQCEPSRLKDASSGHKVSTSLAAQASEARLLTNDIEFLLEN